MGRLVLDIGGKGRRLLVRLFCLGMIGFAVGYRLVGTEIHIVERQFDRVGIHILRVFVNVAHYAAARQLAMTAQNADTPAALAEARAQLVQARERALDQLASEMLDPNEGYVILQDYLTPGSPRSIASAADRSAQ